MENRFGLKDFILYTLVIILGVLVVLTMIQDDRRFKELATISTENQKQINGIIQIREEIENLGAGQLETLQQTLREEVLLLKGQIDRLGEGGSGLQVSQGAALDASGRDLSWARQDALDAVVFPKPYTFVSNPKDYENFAEGGEFIEIFEAQLPKITPYLYSDVYGRRICDGPVCESLGRYDPQTLEWVGLLAEGWQIDPEGMWLRAKINPRARFSDGTKVTAEDFRWTFHDLIFNMQIEAARFRAIYNVIQSVNVISEDVVEFVFDKKQFSNIDSALSMYVVPKHFYAQFTPAQMNEATGLLMGSGPYRLENLDPDNQWSQGEDVVLVRNENYWGVQPPIARLRYKVVANNIARLTAFTNGEGDMIRGTSEQYRLKTQEPDFLQNNYAEQWINMRSGFGFIAWNCGERNGKLTPFADARTRRAMTHLLDRERIRRDFYEGLGEIATGPYPPAGPMNNPDITPLPYDIETAKQLLAEVGWIDRDGNGILENEAGEEFRFEYTISQSSTASEKVASYLKDQCARVGIVCEIRKIDWSIFFSTMDERNFDAITMQWSQSSPESDPYQLWHSNSIADRGDNFVQWSNPRADELIVKGRGTLDDAERMKIWHELHEVFHEEQPYTFLLNSPWIRFISKRVGNVHPYPIGLDINEMFIADN